MLVWWSVKKNGFVLKKTILLGNVGGVYLGKLRCVCGAGVLLNVQCEINYFSN